MAKVFWTCGIFSNFRKFLLLLSTCILLYTVNHYWSANPDMADTASVISPVIKHTERKGDQITLLENKYHIRLTTSITTTRPKHYERNIDEKMTSPLVIKQSVAEKKCILLYKNSIGIKTGQDLFDFDKCNVSNCRVSTDISDLNISKVIIFFHNTLPKYPPNTHKSQWWIFTSSESPPHTATTFREPQWESQFNWVMNYRHDSDFFFGYGDIIQKKQGVSKNYDEIYSKKTRDVAWIVSHCQTMSKRELYVNEMKKYIDVDIFGACGNTKSCKSYNGNEDDTCHAMIGTKYKFYLSFENVLCKDYTTEKLYFAFALDKNVIPVVRGATNSKEYLPNDAMIFTEDFKSPKELAKYLKELGSNSTKYIEFLKKKDKYTTKTSPQTLNEAFCSICQKLQSLDESKRKTIDIANWMMTGTCQEPTDLVFN